MKMLVAVVVLALGLAALTTAAPNAPPGDTFATAVDHDASPTTLAFEEALAQHAHAAALADVRLEHGADSPSHADRLIVPESLKESARYAEDSPPPDMREDRLDDTAQLLATPPPRDRGIALC